MVWVVWSLNKWINGQPFQQNARINWHLHIFQCKSLGLLFSSLIALERHAYLLNTQLLRIFSFDGCVCVCVSAFFLLLMNFSTNTSKRTRCSFIYPISESQESREKSDVHPASFWFQLSSVSIAIDIDTWRRLIERERESKPIELICVKKCALSDWHRNLREKNI